MSWTVNEIDTWIRVFPPSFSDRTLQNAVPFASDESFGISRLIHSSHILCLSSVRASMTCSLAILEDLLSVQPQFSLLLQSAVTSHLLFPLAPGSTLLSGHPRVSDWSGRDWSDDQNLSRHFQAPPWWLPADDGDASLCFSALLSTAPSLSGCAQGEAMWWVSRVSLFAYMIVYFRANGSSVI